MPVWLQNPVNFRDRTEQRPAIDPVKYRVYYDAIVIFVRKRKRFRGADKKLDVGKIPSTFGNCGLGRFNCGGFRLVLVSDVCEARSITSANFQNIPWVNVPGNQGLKQWIPFRFIILAVTLKPRVSLSLRK